MFTNVVKKGKLLSFDIEDIDVCIVNAIRRIILSEVPTVAFAFDPNSKENDIDISKNTGALHNEFLGHRISLLPLHFTEEEVTDFDPTDYNFVLKVKNDTEGMKDITTNNFEIYDAHGNKYNEAFHNRVFPANEITKDYVLITQLKPNLFDKTKGDAIELNAKASVGIGKIHARWCPVSLCTYYNNIDDEKAEKGFKEYLIKMKHTGLSESELRIRFNTLEKFRHFKTNKYLEPSSFHFDMESECGLEPDFIFKKAIDVLIEKLQKLIEDKSRVKIEQVQGMAFVTLDKEDHTMGNLIQAMFYNMFIRDGPPEDKLLSYIGYYKPHPLEDNIVVKMKLGEEVGDTKKVFEQGLGRIAQTLDQIKNQFVF